MIQKTILFFIMIYRSVISPLILPRCRFYPSCSQYCYDAVEQCGVVKGLFFSIKRILRCHPFNPGGYDPVPKK
ncbi:MAG: membrane protein insertion efficiency factor YidD [Bacillota bacterium]|nr:membrane protein insertion efficiency factor YidD [Bacillota bacterium]